jgi:hypothetical protein
MVRAYLLSFLSRQQLVLKEHMAERYPHCWLAWEPGAWSVPPAAGDMAATRVPTPVPVDRPAQGDALCFELQARSDGAPLKLGRAAGNDVVINDATVSRDHIHLAKTRDGWMAGGASQSKSTYFGSMPLSPGQQVLLADLQKFKVGDVVFTFHEPASFIQRLAGIASALR